MEIAQAVFPSRTLIAVRTTHVLLFLPVWEYRKATAILVEDVGLSLDEMGARLFPTKSRADFCSVDEKVCSVFIKDLVSQWLGNKAPPFLGNAGVSCPIE